MKDDYLPSLSVIMCDNVLCHTVNQSERKSGSFEGSSSAGIDPSLPFKFVPMDGRNAQED